MNGTRRSLFKLSGAAVAMLAGAPALAQAKATRRTSRSSTWRSASSGKASTPIRSARRAACCRSRCSTPAVRFQADHKEHAETLAGAIRKMGGKPVEPKSLAEYANALKADRLKTQNDVLDLARLGLGATNAYLGVIPSFNDRELARVAARLAADEVMHWTILNNALGRPLPAGGMPFGA